MVKVVSKIPMTAPVSQTNAGDNVWTITFYMPPGMNLDATPCPLDSRVSLRAVGPRKIAAIRFRGSRKGTQLDDHTNALKEALNSAEIAYIDKPIYAFYSAPYVPVFLRKNEVLLELK